LNPPFTRAPLLTDLQLTSTTSACPTTLVLLTSASLRLQSPGAPT
jgi:hypothetical protein